MDHLLGHVAALRLAPLRLEPPFACLLASGGHTLVLDVADYATPARLGGTLDDAAGEAFDKGARLLGLSEAGGAALELVARDGDAERFPFPHVLRGQAGHDLSFSGLKTALLRAVRELGDDLPAARADLAAAYQAAIVRQLVERAEALAGRPRARIPGGRRRRGGQRSAARGAGRGLRAAGRAPAPAAAGALRRQRGDDRRGSAGRAVARARCVSRARRLCPQPTGRLAPDGERASRGHAVVYPHRVMTRRRRLRTRTLLLALAAALAGAVVLPALGAPDQVQQALRSWDPVIGDGRGGEPLPVQVIVVLAAPPAVTIDSPDASKVATATQQLDLDALTRAGIVLGVQYRYVNALNAVSATVRPDQLAQLQAAPEVAGVYPVRKVYPAETVARHLAKLGAAARPLAGARPAAASRSRCSTAPSTAPIRICTNRLPAGTRSTASRRTPRRVRWPRRTRPRWPGS